MVCRLERRGDGLSEGFVTVVCFLLEPHCVDQVALFIVRGLLQKSRFRPRFLGVRVLLS